MKTMTVLDAIVKVDRVNRLIKKYENLEKRTSDEDDILDAMYEYRELLYSMPVNPHK